MSKDVVFTVKLETALRDAFVKEAATTHRPASQLVREFMREFVERQREAREHDRWFRRRVREAIESPSAGLAHDDVLKETRAIIDRIALSRT